MNVGKRYARWKLMAIVAAFAIGSALETGLVVAQWITQPSEQQVAEVAQVCAALSAGTPQAERAAC